MPITSSASQKVICSAPSTQFAAKVMRPSKSSRARAISSRHVPSSALMLVSSVPITKVEALASWASDAYFSTIGR